ncbi:hypothetical protein Tco_0480746, partial [Tanacetum coccineum]
IVEIDKVNHAMETDIVKLVVEIKSYGISSDEFDKETGSSDGLQPKQADLNYVHTLNKLHLHEIHVVPSKHEVDQVKTTSTPIETQKSLLKDEDGEEVDVHMYRSMIGSLMYLTSSRLDIMFDVFACARYQVNPKVSHLHAVKRIFRYLKGQPKLGLWYLKDSSFDLVAYTNSDYAGESLDRKSTTRGCQFLRYRLISWQCKKQTVVANSTTEAKYVAALSCCGQVLCITPCVFKSFATSINLLFFVVVRVCF